MVRSGGHRMVNVLSWRGMALYTLLSGGVWHGMSCRAWHRLSYGLARYGTVYDMALWAWHGIWYGLVRYGMVYDIVWR